MAFVNEQAAMVARQENEGVGEICFVALEKHWVVEAIGFRPNKVMRVGKQMLAATRDEERNELLQHVVVFGDVHAESNLG